MVTINSDMTADQPYIPLADPAALAPGYYTIDSEAVLVRVEVYSPKSVRWNTLGRYVDRAVGGSTAATHLSGATLTRYYPDAAGVGGGGGVEVNSTAVTNIVAPGAVVAGDEATLGKWTLSTTTSHADLSVTATAASDGTFDAIATRTATGTSSADSFADTIVNAADGDAHADTTVTVTGIQDANAKTTATTFGGNADVSRIADSTDAGSGGGATANTSSTSAGSDAEAKTTVTAPLGTADSSVNASTDDGSAVANTDAAAMADGDATVGHLALVFGTGTATASLNASHDGLLFAGMTAVADATSHRMGFYGATPVARPVIPAVPTEQDIADVLVALGLATQTP